MYNHYEASEIVEVGKAEEMILGSKTEAGFDEPGLEPYDKRTLPFANYDE